MTSPVSSVSSVSSVADVADIARGTISRRAVVIGSAWAVPVIASSSTLQLAAASAGPAVSVSVPNGRVPAAGQSPVTAVVVDSSGSPVAGVAVSFTGSSGVSFSPSNATTDGAGQATTTATTSNAWAVPGSTITVSALSGGASATAATTVLGANAYATGDNQYGSAGTGSGDSMLVSASQVALAFPSPVRSIVSANGFSLAVLEDGSVWSIGRNSRGQLGDGTTTNRSTWAVIPGISNAVAVAAAATSFGAGTGYALLANKTVLAWGANGSGQLGNGTTAGSSTPVAVSTISSAVGIAAGQSTAYALLSDGSVMAWGDNSSGQLGSGTAGGTSSSPVAVGGISDAVEMVAGNAMAFVRRPDGTVMAWGRGDYGQLGNGSTSSTASVVQVSSIGSSMATAVGLAAGDSTGYAVLTDGTIASWGLNNKGQLGNGTDGVFSNVSSPVTVSGITNATAVRGGDYSAYAVGVDGRVRAWGSGSSGQLATGTNNDQNTPVIAPDLRSGTRLTPSSPLSSTLHLLT